VSQDDVRPISGAHVSGERASIVDWLVRRWDGKHPDGGVTQRHDRLGIAVLIEQGAHLVVSADQPNTGERCPRCDGEGTDPYFDGPCHGVAHQRDARLITELEEVAAFLRQGDLRSEQAAASIVTRAVDRLRQLDVSAVSGE
jgi:hypothetical protein